MTRHWLTSTTALALVLNAAAPLPSTADGMATPDRVVPELSGDVRLAENENSTAAQDLMSDVLGDASASASGEEGGANSVEAQAAADAAQAQAEAEAAAAQAEGEAAAAQVEAEAAAKRLAEAEAAAQKQVEAGAAAQVQAEADAEAAKAQAEANAAAKAEADAVKAQDEADAKAATAEADAQAEADTAAKAEADAAAAQAEAEAVQAQANAAAKAEADAEAAAAADTQNTQAQTGENATTSVIGETPQSESTESIAPDVLPQVSAEDQASAAELADESAGSAAAASGEGEVVDTQQVTVTEAAARASNEEFDTTASGQQTPTAQAAQTAAPAVKEKDNELLKNIGIAAAAGLGAYVIGRMLDGGGKVVSNTGDRVVVQEPSGAYRIIKDDDILLRRPGNAVQTQTYSDGSTRSSVTGVDGSSTVTIRAADGRVLRRTRMLPDGRSVVLFDDTKTYARVDLSELERAGQTVATRNYDYSTSDVDQLRMALSASNGQLPKRTFSLNQIRRIDAVRHLVPVITLDDITFKTGSSVIEADEAQDLSDLGRAMTAAIKEDPRQVFLIEGHTDTVGDASYNLALSDRRAESVALALSEYFGVPPSNMIVQGYGESDLRIRRQGDIRANRRGAVRNITPLLDGGR